MRIREPRESWIVFLLVWGALFGGIPITMMVVTIRSGMAGRGGGGVPSMLFLVLFPLVAAVVVGFGLRRWLRSGFTVTPEGLRGAHDAEHQLVEWADVDRFEWRHAGPTSSVRVNGQPLPSGPALFVVLVDGRALRVMQACAPRDRQRSRIHAQLDDAYDRGIVPVHLDRRVHPEGGPGAPGVDGPRPPAADGDVPVTRWSSTGRGEALPDVDDGPVWPGA